MSERGVFAVDRGIFDHPMFAKEAFTEREAWLWLISSAAWKPHTRRVGNFTVELARGQVTASVRFLAERWGWSKSRVDRFLSRLKTGTLIGTDAGTGILIVSICNFNEYQRVGLPSGTDAGTGIGTEAGQRRNIETLDKDIEGRGRAPAREASGLVLDGEVIPPPSRKPSQKVLSQLATKATADGFDAFWQAYPKKVEKLGARKAYDRAVANGTTPDEIEAGARRYAAERDRHDPKYTKGPQPWLNNGCWADEPAPRGPPPREQQPGLQTGTSSILAGMMSARLPGE